MTYSYVLLLQLTVRRKTVNRKPQILSLPSDLSDVMGLILMPIFYHRNWVGRGKDEIEADIISTKKLESGNRNFELRKCG